MFNRLLVLIGFLGIVSSWALAESDRYLIIVENDKPAVQNALAGYPGRCWAITADKIYLDGGPRELVWLTAHDVAFKTTEFDDDRLPLYLCYFGDESPIIGPEKILDKGANYILATAPIENARYCRRLRLLSLPLGQAETPIELLLTFNPLVDTLIGRVNQDTLIYYLSRLSGQNAINIGGQLDTILTRYSGTADISVAAQYIKQVLDGYGYQASLYGYYRGTLRHVAVYDGSRAWAVSEDGQALRTTNGGIVWNNMTINVSAALWGVSHLGADSIWITGDAGTIRFSSNGGSSFVSQSAATGVFFFGSSFISSTRGWIAADSGLVYRTTNGGGNWSRHSTSVTSRLYDVYFADSLFGWAVGQNGVIIHTSTGGTSWVPQTSNTLSRLYGVDFTDRNNGWAVGLDGVVLHTTNGGSDWQIVNLGALAKYHVDFADSLHGCIVGIGGDIYITSDGGNSWQAIVSGTGKDFYGVEFADTLNGFAVGTGIIARTTDGGFNWINQVSSITNAWLNVIATKTGNVSPQQQVIICGHYDDRSQQPLTLAPGADDNGSGTIGVIEAARIFASKSFEKTIKFCLWSGEEQGLYGSADYAAEAYHRGDNIVGVFNFDMISYDGNDDGSAELHCGPGASSQALGNLLMTVVSDYGISLTPNVIGYGAVSASDHSSFWNYNYPAMLGIEDYSSDFNPYYHTTNDNMSHIMPVYFYNFAKAAIGATAALAVPMPSGIDTTGAIAGRVLDRWGNPINGAIVSVVGFLVIDTSVLSGDYLLGGLNPGTYSINCTHADYRDTTFANIPLIGGDTTALEIRMTARCVYIPGDINGDSSLTGGDVTYGVRYFKGLGSPPPNSCYHDSLPYNHYLYVAGDVNGNCEFRGSDITRLVAYFKGHAALSYCHWFPSPLRASLKRY
jgi:photosystem II stability/assembly factor-like uncharacterized protein